MPRVGFEPTIAVFEQAKTFHVLDRAAVIGTVYTEHEHRKTADIHSCLEWDSNPRSQCSSGQRHFVPQTAQPLGSILSLLCVLILCKTAFFSVIGLFPLDVLIFMYDRICVVYLSYVSFPLFSS
jgi:hypothetical protein